MVNAPLERVFEFVSDLDRHMQWITGMTYASPRGKLKVGMQYESKNSALGREFGATVKVLKVEPNRLVELESTSKPLDSVITFETVPVEGCTRVIVTLVIRSDHPVFGLARPLLESLAQTRLEADLRNLKTLAEADI